MVKWLLFVTVVAYNIVDTWQTVLLLQMGAVEMNPTVKFYIDYFDSYFGIVAIKILPIMVLGWGLYLHQKYRET